MRKNNFLYSIIYLIMLLLFNTTGLFAQSIKKNNDKPAIIIIDVQSFYLSWAADKDIEDTVDRIKTVQSESKTLDKVEKGKDVAISLPHITLGRQLKEEEILYSDINENEFRNINVKSSPGFKLYQNYPNPFNPETTIQYDLPESEYVQLTIFNILGKKVSTLISDYKSAGNHQVTWNVKNNGVQLAGGIYFAQLKSESISKCIRLLYLP